MKSFHDHVWCVVIVCYSKPAPLDNLEVDEYIWSILQSSSSDAEEVTIDASANWKPSKFSYTNIKVSRIFQLLTFFMRDFDSISL